MKYILYNGSKIVGIYSGSYPNHQKYKCIEVPFNTSNNIVKNYYISDDKRIVEKLELIIEYEIVGNSVIFSMNTDNVYLSIPETNIDNILITSTEESINFDTPGQYTLIFTKETYKDKEIIINVN